MNNGLSKIVFLNKKKISQNAWVFSFKKTSNFLPGQFVSVFLENDSRDFTIASSPLEKDFFYFITKNGESAFKKKLFSLPDASTLLMSNPLGGFVLHETDTTPRVFLAGGIGITPFHSMIVYVHEKKLQIPITLFVSFSKQEEMILHTELMKIEKENPLLKIIYTLSQDVWDGEHGRISKKLIKKYIPNVKNVKYMIAGGEAMVEDTENLLLQMGVDQKNIRLDIFTGY